MKKWLKITLIIIFAPLVIGIPITIAALAFAKDPTPVKSSVVKPYILLTNEEKQIEIDLFTSGKKYESRFATVNNLIIEGVKSSVKYPETVEILFNNENWVEPDSFVLLQNNFKVVNLKKGELIVSVDFRSENSFGQKIRNKFSIKFRLNQKKEFELIDIIVVSL
jgi:hypothetical protein